MPRIRLCRNTGGQSKIPDQNPTPPVQNNNSRKIKFPASCPYYLFDKQLYIFAK